MVTISSEIVPLNASCDESSQLALRGTESLTGGVNCCTANQFKLNRFLVPRSVHLLQIFTVGWKTMPCARCCATPISSRNRFKPYKLDRIATACMLMCATRQNSVSLRFWEVTHHAHVCVLCHQYKRDVVLLPFRQEIDSSRTNLID